MNKSPPPNLTLRLEVRRRYLAGENMRSIASTVGRSKARIWQIICSLGINKDGGLFALQREGRLKRDAKEARMERAYQSRWGITRALGAEIRKRYGSKPFRAFNSHRAGARERGIPFNLTFQQWWGLWADSGNWARRGTGKRDFCMTRLLDKGAYEIGNVVIRTASANHVEYQRYRRNLNRMRSIGAKLANRYS